MKNTTKKYDPSFGSRNEWKDQAENEIITLLEKIDDLELPEDKVLKLEKLVETFKRELNTCIETFSITPEMIAIQDKGELLTDLFDAIYYERIQVSESDIDRLKDIIEDNTSGQGFKVIKIENLAQEIRFEEFEQSLIDNP